MDYLIKQLEYVQSEINCGKVIEEIMPLKIYAQKLFAKNLISLIDGKGKILEVGCGGSLTLHFLSLLEIKAYGVDNSEVALRYQSLLKNYFKSETIVCKEDALSMSFKNASFDIVYSIGMIEHFSKKIQIKIVKEMKRVSKKYIVLGVPNYDKFSAFNPLYTEHKDDHLECDLRELMLKNGLTVIKEDGRGVFNDKVLIDKNELYKKFILEKFPELYKNEFRASDIDLMQSYESKLTIEDRKKYGFIKLIFAEI